MPVSTVKLPRIANALGPIRAPASWLAAVVAVVPTASLLGLSLWVGADQPLPWLGYAGALIVLALSIWLLLPRAMWLAISLAMLLSLERLIVAVAVPRLDADSVNALLAYNEFVFPLIIALGLPRFLRRWRTQPRVIWVADGVMIALGLLTVLGLLLGAAPPLERILYARRFLLLPMVYFAARVTVPAVGDSRRVAAVIFATGLALSLFGLFERFSPPGTVWGGLVDPVAYYERASYSGRAHPGMPGSVTTIDGLPHAFWAFEGGCSRDDSCPRSWRRRPSRTSLRSHCSWVSRCYHRCDGGGAFFT